MKTPAALLLLASALAATTRAHEFRACKGVTDRLAVRELRVAPDPPQAGHPITVTVSGTPAVDVPGGQVTVDIKVFGVLVSEQRFDLCAVAQCPLAKDQAITAAIQQDIPAETPDKIPALVRVTITSSQGEVVSCLETTVQLADKTLTQEEVQEKPAFGLVRSELKFLFDRWKQQFAKKIAQSAEQHRLGVFSRNVFRIALHNADRSATFKMAMNEFGDMTEQEFAQTRLSGLRPGFRPATDIKLNADGSNVITLRGSLVDPPAEVDWTQRGAVTPVKNQGSCGSCWAFSAVAAMEAQYFLKTGNLVEFSEQLLVSCDGDGIHGGVDYACQGGFMDNAFDWVQHSTSGLCTEADYPYASGTTSARGECRINECTPVPGSQVQGYVDVPPTEAALLTAVAEHGPLSVAIEADQAAFQFYHSGVLHGQCGSSLNHGVLVVGYGVDQDTGAPFWKVKNSWGAGWGEAGYVRIQRGKRWPSRFGECGIASKASYPVF